MKIASTLLALAALALAAPAVAGGDHGMGHGMAHGAQAAAASAASHGTVKKIDAAKGRITIAHGPLANLGMPAMTMAFVAAEAAMLERVKPGDKVSFTAENVDGKLTVTAIDAAH